MPHHPTFRRHLFAMFLSSLIVPLLLVSLSSALFFNARLQETRSTDLSNVLSPMAENIDSKLAELDRIAFAPYLYQGMLNAMDQMNHGYLENPPAWLDAPTSERDYVSTMQRLMVTSSQRIRSVVFYPAAGDGGSTYSITPEVPGLVTHAVPGFRDADWYREALATGKVFLGPSEADGNSGYALAVAIRDIDRRREIGVLRIDASSSQILAGIADTAKLGSDRVLLVDSDNVVRYEAGAGPTATEFDREQMSKQYLMVEAPLHTAPWRLVYLAEDQTSSSTMIAVALAVLVAGATALLAWFVYRREARSTLASVSGIVDTLSRMEEGDLSARARVHTRNELGLIARSVNDLGFQLSSRIDREYRAVIARQNAEYRALQAQLSPHFLHNVLNDLVALNRMGERHKLEESIMRFSRLMRYSCSTADTAFVSEEVAFAEQYLYLRHMQLDGRLDYEIDVADDAASVEIPRLVVQPLVENAIKHGLRDDKDHIDVRVRAQIVDEYLEISVHDDGAGLSRSATTAPTGFATMSIEERLRIFAPSATFEIATDGGATRCLIRLPLSSSKVVDAGQVLPESGI